MNTNDYIIRLETPADYQEVENLTREAFWNVYRPGCLEHYVMHCYRDRKDFVPELDFVMEKDGKIIGHVMYVHAKIQADDGREIPIMTFGPISIAPENNRQGSTAKHCWNILWKRQSHSVLVHSAWKEILTSMASQVSRLPAQKESTIMQSL